MTGLGTRGVFLGLAILLLSAFQAQATDQGWCGDSLINSDDEECDGGDFGGKSCADFGYTTGHLNCLDECIVDQSSCLDADDGLTVFMKAKAKLEVDNPGAKPSKIKYFVKASYRLSVVDSGQGAPPVVLVDDLESYASSPKAKRGTVAPEVIRLSMEGQPSELALDLKRKTYSGCVEAKVTGVGDTLGGSRSQKRAPEASIPVCVEIRSKQLFLGLKDLAHKASVTITTEGADWRMRIRGRGEVLPCSPVDTDGDGFGDECDRCPNNETEPVCGLKPSGLWGTYDTYYSGCGCDDSDGIDFSTSGAAVFEIEQPEPERVAPGICLWPPNFSEWQDSCLDENTAIDWVCGAGEAPRRTFECEFGCENGRCLCADSDLSDSDGGDNPYRKGTTAAGNEDSCRACLEFDDPSSEFPNCILWEAVATCEGVDADRQCHLQEYFVEGTPLGPCADNSRQVICASGPSSGPCEAGRCPLCEKEDDPFVADDLDRCVNSGEAVEERFRTPECLASSPSTTDCEVGCSANRCLCRDTDLAHPGFRGVDAFGRQDVCDGSDLIERWAVMGAETCEPREQRISCPNGCAEGRCIPSPEKPQFTFACVNVRTVGVTSVDPSIDDYCRRSMIGFVALTEIDDFVDVRISEGNLGSAPRPHREWGAGFAAPDSPISSIRRIEADMRIVMADRIFDKRDGSRNLQGYTSSGVNWVVLLAPASGGYYETEHPAFAHELGHAFALVSPEPTAGQAPIEPNDRRCGGTTGVPCKALCDEYNFATYGEQAGRRNFSCVNSFPETCVADYVSGVSCAGHELPGGGTCDYGRNGGPAFTAEELAHFRTWFAAWAAGR